MSTTSPLSADLSTNTFEAAFKKVYQDISSTKSFKAKLNQEDTDLNEKSILQEETTSSLEKKGVPNSEASACAEKISNLMFKFPKLNYNIKSRGDGRDASKLIFNRKNLLIGLLLSIAWAGLVTAYGAGFMTVLVNYQVAKFVYASLAMIVIFPIVLIWSGFFVYHYANQSHKANSAILEAARILSSPAIVATDDVKTLSSAVGHELNQLRGAMRDIEDRMNGVSKNIQQEIDSLDEGSSRLNNALRDVSGTIRAERDAIIDLMKIVKTENKNAYNYLAEKAKTNIEVSDISDHLQSQPIESPKSTGKILGGEITYVNDLRELKHSYDLENQQKNQLDIYMKQENISKDNKPIDDIRQENIQEKIQTQPVSHENTQNKVTTEKHDTRYNIRPEAVILRRERQLYESVCALTVDLNRELGISLPQELWSRYMRGERHIFAEYLFDKLTSNFSAYQKALDTENIRKLCNQFIARFEALRDNLFNDPDIAVSEYLENSGVGKVYSVLSVEYV